MIELLVLKCSSSRSSYRFYNLPTPQSSRFITSFLTLPLLFGDLTSNSRPWHFMNKCSGVSTQSFNSRVFTNFTISSRNSCKYRQTSRMFPFCLIMLSIARCFTRSICCCFISTDSRTDKDVLDMEAFDACVAVFVCIS